ncbi:hypothetical protein FACS189472_17260 [Alphaproteobacteria bacterium]|nr:hypothetical protein FACS189472_17260 [Alphaproteobacteria bacterium]
MELGKVRRKVENMEDEDGNTKILDMKMIDEILVEIAEEKRKAQKVKHQRDPETEDNDPLKKSKTDEDDEDDQGFARVSAPTSPSSSSSTSSPSSSSSISSPSSKPPSDPSFPALMVLLDNDDLFTKVEKKVENTKWKLTMSLKPEAPKEKKEAAAKLNEAWVKAKGKEKCIVNGNHLHLELLTFIEIRTPAGLLTGLTVENLSAAIKNECEIEYPKF